MSLTEAFVTLTLKEKSAYYTPTYKGSVRWDNWIWDDKDMDLQAQQQIMTLCSDCEMTVEEFVFSFKLTFPQETEKHRETRRLFDYAIENINRLLYGLEQKGDMIRCMK